MSITTVQEKKAAAGAQIGDVIVERGSDVDGEYALLADGFEIRDKDYIDAKAPTIYMSGSSAIVLRTNAVTTISGTYNKKREHKILASGKINVSFNLKHSTGTGTAYGRIYINGIAVGTAQSTNSTTYVVFIEEFDVANGDLIQLYMRTTSFTASDNSFTISAVYTPAQETIL